MAQKYPLARFYFQVDWGGKQMSFMEITGLDIQTEAVEYRHGDSKEFSKIKMPGMQKYSNITMKRGRFEGDNDYYDWMSDITNERVEKRRDVVIKLLNEKHEAVASWKALRCFPLKITAPDFKSDANEVAVESIEIAHEGLSLVK